MELSKDTIKEEMQRTISIHLDTNILQKYHIHVRKGESTKNKFRKIILHDDPFIKNFTLLKADPMNILHMKQQEKIILDKFSTSIALDIAYPSNNHSIVMNHPYSTKKNVVY